MPDGELVPGLSGVVVERLRSEIGGRAERVLRCLRTAAALIAQAEQDGSGLRLTESAAYNLREALNSVVEGQDASEGGLRAVMDAWQRYKEQAAVPGADAAAARDDLDQVLRRVAANESRASYYARRLVTYLRDRAGIDPWNRRGDPVSEYAELREKANRAVHDELALAEVAALLARAVAWFVRVFTPPDQVVEAIRSLAAEPWRGPEQIAELERLATNDHHLRLFFNEVTDSAWLEPLREADIAQVPMDGAPWPVAGLLEGLGKASPESVAALLERFLEDAAGRPKDEQAVARFELLRVAVQLGPSGHNVVAEVARLHSDLSSVRSLSVHTARKADPADPVVRRVADAVLNHFPRFANGDRYYATEILNHLQAGTTADNVADRARMLAGKIRRLARSDQARYVVLGIEALTVDPDERPEPLLLFAHHLAHMLSKARRWGVPTSVQLEWLGKMRGEVGERLRGHALAGADDIAVADKIAHVTVRLGSSTATGEDLALVTDILSRNPAPEDLADWTETLGTPSSAPANSEDRIPRDWARAWRWAAVLPDHVLTGWRHAIAHVSARHGKPDPRALTRSRSPLWEADFGKSPYSTEYLSARPPLEAAALVSAWQPDVESERQIFGRLELARALAEAVKADPVGWSSDPAAVVTTLSAPLYIEYYFRGLSERAGDIIPQATAVLAAALAQPAAGEGQTSDSDVEKARLERTDTEDAVLGLVRTLANEDADLTTGLDDLWDRAVAAVRNVPETDEGLLFADHDALNSAINRSWGHGLQTMLALAAWEFRNRRSTRPEFEHALDAITASTGSVGLEFRAILGAHRPLLEGIAGTWFEAHSAALFREGPLASETFDLTIKWARPTTQLYQNFKAELVDAALRGADNAARYLAIAALNEVEGYGLAPLIELLHKDPAVLGAVVEDATFLVQQSEPDSTLLTVAVRFWALLLDTDRSKVPAQALIGLGRWAFVDNIDDDQWAHLTARTLDATDGRIDNAVSVADRAARIPPSSTSRDILLRLLDNNEPWERHHAAAKAVAVLHASTAQPADGSFHRLRTRLIDLGHHQASTITPPDPTDQA
ncbi:hypothetical protein GCM10010405_54350 [Streptomyces macrosporus]|uniref:Uncharacterized protein n=1 Tax=Streptomyces macrosporus TaxID=44032 RepID=A0ABN3KJE7_9ACTN